MGSNRERRMLKRMNREDRDRLRELAAFTDDQDLIGEPTLNVTAGLASADAGVIPDLENED